MVRKQILAETLLNTTKEKYARLRAQGAKQVDARRNCRISKSTAGRWEKDSWVQARIARLLNDSLIDQQDKTQKEHRAITIDRNDIIMGLADIAQNPIAADRARVAAYSKLADIFCLVPRSLKDVEEFYGWTEEELEAFRRTNGEFIPERFRHLISKAEPD